MATLSVPGRANQAQDVDDNIPNSVTIQVESLGERESNDSTNKNNLDKSQASLKYEDVNSNDSEKTEIICLTRNGTPVNFESGQNGTEDSFNMKDTDHLTGKVSKDIEEDNVRLRPLERRSSFEKKGLLGLMTPIIPMMPHIYGEDTLTSTFDQLHTDGKPKDLILAAAHIDDALHGRGAFGKAKAIFKPKYARNCFSIIDHKFFTWVMYFVILVHSALTIFEPTQEHLRPGQVHPVFIAIEALCLGMYILDVSLHLVYFTWKTFWTVEETKWMRVEFVFVCLFVVDFIILIVQEIVAVRLVMPFRCLRLAALHCKAKNVAHIFQVCISILVKLGKVFFIIILFIVIFSAIGVHVFMEDYHCIGVNTTAMMIDANKTAMLLNTSSPVVNSSFCDSDSSNVYTGVFDNIAIAFLRLFVLLTSENYPDVMVPAFTVFKINFFYFGIFLYVGVFFLTAVLLAIVVDSYWALSKKHVKHERKRERAELLKAWNILDPLGEGSLAVTDEKMMEIFRILRPKNSDDEIKELIDYVDEDRCGDIDVFDWTTRLTDALQYEFESDIQEFRVLGTSCKGRFKMKIRLFIDSLYFSRFILLLIILHSILFCIKWYGMSDTADLVIQAMKSGIVGIFLVEIILRIISYGRDLQNLLDITDIAFTVIAILANIMWYFVPHIFTVQDEKMYKAAVTVTSCLAVFCRVFFNSRQAKNAFIMIKQIHPVLFDLIIMVGIIAYLYSVLGLEIFYGYKVNTEIDSSHTDHYDCGLGFDDFRCGMLIMFQMVTTSNWHEVMNSAMMATSKWASIFFVTSYVVINLVVMNLFVAIAIEAFNKLATIDEEEPGTDPLQDTQPEKEQATIGEVAKQFFTSVIASSREDRVHPEPVLTPEARRRSISAVSRTSIRNSLAGSRAGSATSRTRVGSATSRNIAVPEIKEDTEESEEDYSGLTPAQIKERKLKKRMKKRKRQVAKIKVIFAFRKKSDDQLDLHVGDEVTILERNGDFIKGMARGKMGWFPANCIKEAKRKAQDARERVSSARKDQDKPPIEKKDSLSVGTQQNGISLNTTVASEVPPINVPEEKPSTPEGIQRKESIQKQKGPRMKKSHGDWRRSIHGDMTVMNQDELIELNRMSKARLRKKTREGSLGRHSSSLSSNMDELNNTITEEDDDAFPSNSAMSSTINLPIPQINVELSSSLNELPEEEEEEEKEEDKERAQTWTLGVQKPSVPAKLKKKEENKTGEMPDWVKNFTMGKNINISESTSAAVDNDIPEIPEEEEEEEIDLEKALLKTLATVESRSSSASSNGAPVKSSIGESTQQDGAKESAGLTAVEAPAQDPKLGENPQDGGKASPGPTIVESPSADPKTTKPNKRNRAAMMAKLKK